MNNDVRANSERWSQENVKRQIVQRQLRELVRERLPLSRSRFDSDSHLQNNAKLGFAAHHACVSLARLFERVSLDHRSHARQCGEVHSVLFAGWCSRSRALNTLSSNNQLERCDLNGIKCNADNYKLAVCCQTVDQF